MSEKLKEKLDDLITGKSCNGYTLIRARFEYLQFMCSNHYADEEQLEEYDKIILIREGRHDMRLTREKEYYKWIKFLIFDE